MWRTKLVVTPIQRNVQRTTHHVLHKRRIIAAVIQLLVDCPLPLGSSPPNLDIVCFHNSSTFTSGPHTMVLITTFPSLPSPSRVVSKARRASRNENLCETKGLRSTLPCATGESAKDNHRASREPNIVAQVVPVGFCKLESM